jgi:tetratricopeptide (TPR) repeat protein
MGAGAREGGEGAARQVAGQARGRREAEGQNVIARAAALAMVWIALVAATPLPLTPPPPDIAVLIPVAAAPVEKPSLATSALPLPSPPAELPPVRPAAILVPAVEKPTAPMPVPGTAPCFWAWLPSAAESLKCGMGRFYRGEHEKAREALEQAVKSGTERELIAEARYWLAETLYIVGRPDQADSLFRQVAQEPRQPLAVWALAGSGWTALRMGDPVRARDVFARLASATLPTPLDGWSRHGLGLALYGVGRFEDAERAWSDLRTRAVPPALTRDLAFWYGETLGRVGRYRDAETELKHFTDAGPHPLLETGLLRQGWWTLAGGRTAEAVAPLRAVVAMPMRPTAGNTVLERDWAESGLALALLATGDVDGARRSAEALKARRSPLQTPVFLRLAAGAVTARRGAEASAIVQELLGGRLEPSERAWALLASGDAQHGDGKRDEARTQYDLARQADPSGLVGWHATLRLARVNFELREFTQAMTDLGPLLGAPLPPDLRSAALLLRGEAAYSAGDYTTATDAFRRALVELPESEAAAGVRLSLGWTALRQGRHDEARRHFLEFATARPQHPLAGDALLLGAELALAAGDLDDARTLLNRMLGSFAGNPRIEFAKLNRALLLLRTGQAAAAQPMLREWIARAPFPPLMPRVHAALGAALLATGSAADAQKAFTDAAKGGESALATLGAGAAALASNRLDEAAKTLADARAAGPAPITAAAEYGLAAVAYKRGDTKSFPPSARAALGGASPATAPALLYVLTGLAVEEKDWTAALDSAKRIVADYPAHETADDALERVGSAAAIARLWPVVHESYALLRQRYPKSPFADAAMVALAEAEINTGRGAEAVAMLERFVAANPTHAEVGRAWLALARARETGGQTPAALEAYAAAIRDARGPDVRREAAAGQARVLIADKKWFEARTLLQSLILDRDAVVAAEAAQAIGETYRGEGDAAAAAEYFMTAAYAAPDAPIARKALLAAAQSLAAAKQSEAAAIVYRKLLAQANVPADIADAARQGLAAIPTR